MSGNALINKLLTRKAQLGQLLNVRRRLTRKRFRELRTTFYADYWRRVAANMQASFDDLGSGFFRLSRNAQHTYVSGYFVQIDDFVTLKIAGNKSLSQKLLHEAGLPVPANLEYTSETLDAAVGFLQQLGGPAVVKPASGAGGSGISTGITDESMLRSATKSAAAGGSSRFLIEKQIAGDNFRLLYINGELVDVIQRDRPAVTGDGKTSIKGLIKSENARRLNGAPIISLSFLSNDNDVLSFLAKSGLRPDSVPGNGERVVVKDASNQNNARENHRITVPIHPSFNDLGRRVCKVLDIRLLGIDIMATTLETSLEESGGAINEVNTTPAFHHHELISNATDECRAGQLAIEYIFSG